MGAVVVFATALSALVFATLVGYACVAQRELGVAEGVAFIVLLLCTTGSLLATVADGMSAAASACAALAYTTYVLYDTSAVMLTMGPDEAVHAALQVYIDALGIVLQLLHIVRCCARDS